MADLGSDTAAVARTAVRFVRGLPALVLVGVFRLWQLLVSPTYGQTCRFYPSCSSYGVEAVRTHGAVRGLGLTAWRILRCNPWNRGGVDPVPPRGRRDAPQHDHVTGAERRDEHHGTQPGTQPGGHLSMHVDDQAGPGTIPAGLSACPDEPAPLGRRAA